MIIHVDSIRHARFESYGIKIWFESISNQWLVLPISKPPSPGCQNPNYIYYRRDNANSTFRLYDINELKRVCWAMGIVYLSSARRVAARASPTREIIIHTQGSLWTSWHRVLVYQLLGDSDYTTSWGRNGCQMGGRKLFKYPQKLEHCDMINDHIGYSRIHFERKIFLSLFSLFVHRQNLYW